MPDAAFAHPPNRNPDIAETGGHWVVAIVVLVYRLT
jgi:hypothetical protein